MTTWIFEPGHTDVAFRVRHMMVTWVRGRFKDVHGGLEFDIDDCLASTFSGQIDATRLWTGEPDRDAPLRSADFFDAENHPLIIITGRFRQRTGDSSFKASADVTTRGHTLPVEMAVVDLGQWESPFLGRDEHQGTLRRMGFEARTTDDQPPQLWGLVPGPAAPRGRGRLQRDRAHPRRGGHASRRSRKHRSNLVLPPGRPAHRGTGGKQAATPDG